MNTATIYTVLAAVVGSGGLTTVVSWILHKLDERNDLEKAIADSPAIKGIRLELYRMTLFMPTTDRAVQERQLEAGEKYVALGGNGAGHARYTLLEDDYKRRLEHDDWQY